MSDRNKLIAAHLLGWTTYILVIGLGADEVDADFIEKSFAGFLPLIALFYVCVYLLFPVYLPGRRYIPVTIWLVVCNVVAVGLRFVIMSWLFTEHIDLTNSGITFWNQFRMNLLFIGMSFAYWYARRNYQVEKRQQLLEKEVLDARLASLKNQINPHFLYNTLSFLYTKSLPLSRDLSDAIAGLSDMMRYSLEVAADDGNVPLEKEIEHIRNFIRIHQLRFEHKLNIDFQTTGNTGQHKIMPLLLITFVENAFKHGKLNDPEHPLHINLSMSGSQLLFQARNLKATGEKEKSSGIGLQNVRNRLNLAYPDRYELVVDNLRDEFIVNLKLMLKP